MVVAKFESVTSNAPWQAVEDLSHALRLSPVVQAMGTMLSVPAAMSDLNAPGFAGLHARVPSAFNQHHLLLATAFNVARSIAEDVVIDPKVLDSAARIEAATRNILAWLRSRLSGYPMLLIPHLVPGTAYTSTEVNLRAGWELSRLQLGDQFTNGPRDVTALLQLKADAKVDERVRVLAAALSDSDEWRRWDRARASARDPAIRRRLADARLTVRHLLAEARVDAFEPSLLIPRNEFRKQQLRDVVDDLSEDAREVCMAFEAVDYFIDFCALDVLGYLTLFGAPRVINSVEKLQIDAGRNPDVRFETSWPILDTGDLWFLEDSLIDDCVFLHSIGFSFDQDSSRTVVAGTRLDHSWGLGSSLV